MANKFSEKDVEIAIQKAIRFTLNALHIKDHLNPRLYEHIWNNFNQVAKKDVLKKLNDSYIVPISQVEVKIPMNVIYKDGFENETFKIVGIRENELELKGDWSGIGACNSPQWVDKSKVFIDIRTL